MEDYRYAGKYFEDWQPGDEYTTLGRTITVTDVEIYTNFMGDYNPLYTDEEFAKRELYGTRIVPEFLIHAISSGQVNQTRLFEGTMMRIAKFDIDFLNPVKPGDTITTRGKLIGKEEASGKDHGIANFYIEVMNQNRVVVSKSNQNIMIKKRNV